MFQPVSLFIGLRYSRSKKRTGFISFITFFSTVGILLGVASLITVVSVMNGFEGELKKRILGIVPHVIVAQDLNDSKPNNFDSWPALREELLKQKHVEQVTPFLSSEALIQSSKNLQGVLLQGIIPEFEQKNIISTHMISGSLNSLSEHPYSIVIGQSLARKLKVTINDTVRLVLPNKTIFTPMGRIPVQRKFVIRGIFDVGSQVDGSMVYVHSESGAKLLRRTADGIDQLRLYLDDAFNAQQVVNTLTAANLQTTALNKLTYTTWSETQGALFSAVNMEKKMMWLMLSLIVAVAAFNIVSALVMVVVEKQGEIGILQTLGLSRAGIVKIFITQGMVNGLWGAMIGSILGVLIALNLNEILSALGVNILGSGYAMQALPVQLELVNVVVIVLSALGMSFIATLYPAFQASKTQPAEVLRNE
ncbi:lipoprotein-releasing ABC transporter permease subunit [Colwellia sp. 1_MG-2023]|uniref:lipoprotein-releasing ABC transporter permease subunit n=1 Tax=unclassified Colwellia TaxID=196834 RepID=UPI001C096CE1|nr:MULTISPECIES: lipoprotein-releasing ABC transporter permease subunit [unclassified Colwellia]MBU2924552.1 lipoprotein-releasing ABC transporter permease subunit [Colwellia sp. C2M11]MDO6653973.1 lipoprotein-releasing ABC transporter permease subunit [Colwellia sp. 3_MG-2023]MDO6666774.1 lipoprotein-releasing ABC transporter permease subunit [Colwellia sp. 2_MG-2023]MDO6691241.1 lipoprotein-releasing ABC transporter permease subunit [Colwellia sp. 1_MG-2023]